MIHWKTKNKTSKAIIAILLHEERIIAKCIKWDIKILNMWENRESI
jgi:hypothetical protein